MSCDQCAKVGIAKFCSMEQPCFQCTGRKITCTYGVPLTANNVLQPFKEALTKVALTKSAQSPKKEFTSAEVAAGAASRAGSPAYEVSNAENSNVEEANQTELIKKVIAMNKESQLNKKNNKNKKRKSRKSRKSKQSRKLKYKLA
jgi:hypothetical protein